jgi:anti-sigma-K factor RskA
MTPPDDDIMDLLAAYALDALEPEEIARVSAILIERPELRATVAELRATADRLPYALAEATPAPDLRRRVLDRATGRTPPRAQAAPDGLRFRARAWLVSLAGLAALAIVAAVLGWAQAARLQNTLQQAQLIASLQGAHGSGTILSTDDGETILLVRLPPLRPGRVYQLWRIQGTSKPASAGLFTVDQSGHGTLALPLAQQPQSGETVAVTDEPDGGSLGPTTDPLITGALPSA